MIVEPDSLLRPFWETESHRVERELEQQLATPAGASERLYQAMRHAVLGGGKRLRPILCLAAYRSLHGESGEIYPVAAAIEMVHTYSLVHDDLPCMDDDDQRRGRPTLHVAFDEATAVLAGDALQAIAFEILATAGSLDVVRLIAAAVGPRGMAGGQMADLEAEGQRPSRELVSAIHRRKTGELITASILTGGIMARAGTHDLRCLTEYGQPLGLAFQIVDDILDLTQTAEQLGKPVGSDLRHDKVTYPAAVGLAKAREDADGLVEQAKSSLSTYGGNRTLLLALADFVRRRDR